MDEIQETSDRIGDPEQRTWLASFPEMNPNPVMEVDLEGHLHYANKAARKLFPDLAATGTRHPVLADLDAVVRPLKGEKARSFSREIAVGNTWYHQTGYFSAEDQRLRVFLSDITEKKKKEAELQRLNRTLKALSNSSQAMMHAWDESEYLKEVCKIIVEDCGHAMVWVGFAEDDEAKTVRPVACAGFEEGYLESLKITWADTERGRGPTGTAIRTGKPRGCRNMLTDPAFKPWREEAIKRGYASSIVLPLKDGGKTFGAINIYSQEPESFSEDEIELLSELASDMAYGIMAIRLREAHAKAEEALHKAHDELEQKVRERTAELARSAESVKAERQRFNDLLEMMPAYVVLLTPDYHVAFANRFFRERFGDSHGRCCFDFLFGRSEPCETCETYKVLATNVPHRWEWTGPDARNYDIFDFPFTDSDGSPLIMEMGIDITERKQAEAALVQAERALVAGKRLSDIGALAASVAHELRNPLGVIQMAAYNLRKKTQDPALERHLANIEKKVLESDQIINNLLGYSRIKTPLYEMVSLPDLVNECLENTAKRFQTHKVRIEKDLKAVREETIEADPVQIKEVLNNILANAYQAMEDNKGRIQIRGSLTPGGEVEIRIQDNGAGIEKEDLELVFDPFFTRKSRGTGLGLSICQELVRLHGGRIEIQSEKGKGTSVAVALPRRREEP